MIKPELTYLETKEIIGYYTENYNKAAKKTLIKILICLNFKPSTSLWGKLAEELIIDLIRLEEKIVNQEEKQLLLLKKN